MSNWSCGLKSPREFRPAAPVAAIAIVLLLLAVNFPSIVAAAAQSGALADATSSTSVIATSGDWSRHQQLSSGYLVSFSTAATTNSVILTSLETGSDQAVSLNLGSTAATILTAAAVSGVNSLVLAGVQLPSDNQGMAAFTGGASSFLTFADLGGRAVSRINLGTFAANQVCAGADGNVWVLGQDMAKEGSFWRADATGSVPEGDDYDLVRVYSPQGVLLRSLVKRSTLQSVGRYLHLGETEGNALACGDSSVGVYLAPAGGQSFQARWIEVDLGTQRVSQWSVYGAPAAARLTGVALPHGNTAYASFTSHEASGYVSGIYSLTLGTNDVAIWSTAVVRSDNPHSALPSLKVLGSDAGVLKYVDGSSQGTDSAIVVSAKVRQSEAPHAALAPSRLATPDTTKTVTASEAGNVQLSVDQADYLLRGLSLYEAACYSSATITERAALQATVNQWKGAAAKTRATASFDVEIKEAIASEMSKLNADFKAQTSKTACYSHGHGGGGGKVIGPDDQAPSAQGSSGLLIDRSRADSIFVSQPFRYYPLRVLLVDLDSCRHTCDVKGQTYMALCALLVVLDPTPFGVAVAAACVIGEGNAQQNCWDACPPDTSCPDSGNYYVMNDETESAAKHRGRPPDAAARG